MSTELTRRQETKPEMAAEERWFAPAVDVYENDQEWLIQADLPGVPKDGLTLNLDKDELVIEARLPATDGTAAPMGYRRIFALPAGIDPDKVTAELDCGVVAIHLPKSEAVRPRQIPVKAG